MVSRVSLAFFSAIQYLSGIIYAEFIFIWYIFDDIAQ